MIYLHGGYCTDGGIKSDFYKIQMSDVYEERSWEKIQEKGKIK